MGRTDFESKERKLETGSLWDYSIERGIHTFITLHGIRIAVHQKLALYYHPNNSKHQTNPNEIPVYKGSAC